MKSTEPGAPEPHWILGRGSYAGNRAELEVVLIADSSPRLFPSPGPEGPREKMPAGNMIVDFMDCRLGTIAYELPKLGLLGEMKIFRADTSEETDCELP
jgi:hypothetical protein